MKKFVIILFSLLCTTSSYTVVKYLLVFKPNAVLEYKVQIQSTPDSFIQNKIFGMLSDSSIVQISISENDGNSYIMTHKLKMLDKKSCCNPLTYPGYVYTFDGNIENTIKPTGEFIKNQRDYTSLGCIFGFNLVNFNNNKSHKDKPVIIPFYFPEKEISIGESWMCNFEFEDKEKTYALLINYTLKNITNNIAYIDGYNLDGLHITSNFDIVKGCWIDYKMYFKKDTKEYLWKSYELIK